MIVGIQFVNFLWHVIQITRDTKLMMVVHHMQDARKIAQPPMLLNIIARLAKSTSLK